MLSPKNRYLIPLIVFVAFMLSGCSILFLSKEKTEIKEHLSKANELLKQEKYDQALEKYDLLLTGYPENPWKDEALFNLSCLYVYYTNPQQSFNTAKIYLEQILLEFPQSRFRKETLALLAILNALSAKENERIRINRELSGKEQEINRLRQTISSLEIEQFTTFLSMSKELFSKERELEEFKMKIQNQENEIKVLRAQMKKIKEVDIQHEKKKTDEDE